MMRSSKWISILVCLGFFSLPAMVVAQSASDLLLEAQHAEEMQGDLDKAIELYDQVIALERGRRSYKAQALFRKAMCYRKQSKEGRAKATLEQLISDYTDQDQILAKAKRILEDLSIVDPATLMPPGTLAYIEIGSPGKQVETILNMLKGTPGENPMHLLKLLGIEDWEGGDKSPSEILAAIFNPSTMEELKKIRGMAAGLVGFKDGNGQGMVVIYPGECHTLRGFLEAGIRVAGKPGKAIGSMETLNIEDQAFIALDDKAILVSQSQAQLEWAVQQYLGLAQKPSLAQQQAFFGRVTKKARQDNTLTLWANTNAIYEKVVQLVGVDNLPEEMAIADTVLDLSHLDELMASFSIKPDGLQLDLRLNLQEGHQCLVYNMIHTPNITEAGLGVPGDAFLLGSFALGAESAKTVDQLRGPLQQITGLDIGREIFANIEQVNIFAIPPTATLAQQPPEALLSCLGLSVTSHAPQQTLQLLESLLGTAAQISGDRALASDARIRQFNIKVDRQTIPCFLGQRGKTTVLTLDQNLAQRALRDAGKLNALTALKKPLSQATADTSKLVAVNVGGLLTLLDVMVEAEHKNPQNPGHQALRELAKACAQTTVQIRTDETAQKLHLRLGIDSLPGLDSIVAPIAVLSQVDVTRKVQATRPEPGPNATTLADTPMLSWKSGAMAKKHQVYFGNSGDNLSLLGETRQTNTKDLKLPVLTSGQSYAWRVDELWQDGTVITGSVWQFKTAELVAHYPLGENALDETGNGHHGTIQGEASWAAGPTGKALFLDGKGTHVEIPGDITRFDRGFTIALWAKPTRVGNWSRFVEFGSAAPQDNITFGRKMKTESLMFELYRGQQWQGLEAPGRLKLNTWQHFAVTCDAKGYVTLYRNGKRVASRKFQPARQTQRKVGYLGKALWEDNQDYQGGLDDVRIYGTALNGGAIQRLYKLGNPPKANPQPQPKPRETKKCPDTD